MKHLSAFLAAAEAWAALALPLDGELSDAEVLEFQRHFADVRREADSRSAQIAGIIAHRSRPELGYDGLAQRSGARTPQGLVQQITGVSRREASTLVRVGGLMDGVPTAPDAPSVAPWLAMVGEAVSSERLSATAADVIYRALGGLTVADDLLSAAASTLLREAERLDVDRLAVLARQVRDQLDAEGVAAREHELREKRWVRLFRQPNGMTRISGELDPESAAQIGSVVDAATSPRRGGPRFVNPKDRARERRIVTDPRTTEQLTVDALVDVLRVGLSGDVAHTIGRQLPAVRIHVAATDLHRRAGAAHIEGQSAAVSVATAARHLCAAGGIPILFDGGRALDLGRTQRLFSHRQRIALAARDGGCRFPGCDRPPGWCEAHHINQWNRDQGKTDIADGVLLCRHHHMLVHNNHWRVTRTGADYFLTPPRSHDPEQRPIPAPSRMPRHATAG